MESGVKFLVLYTSAAVSLAGASFAAAAQTPSIADFSACGQIGDDDDRLECFDRTLERLAPSAIAAEPRDPEEDFGLSAAQREERDRRAAPAEAQRSAELQEVSGIVEQAFVTRNRKRAVLLDNGQLWLETSNSSLRGDIREGASVTIRRGKLSGFRLRVDGRTGFVGVRRVR